jgi:hypothetical protein
MQKTLKLFREKQSPYPVIVGGAPVTRVFADHIGADGYGENAPEAVETVPHRRRRLRRKRAGGRRDRPPAGRCQCGRGGCRGRRVRLRGV